MGLGRSRTRGASRATRWNEWSRRDRINTRTRHLPPGSRWLYRVDHLSSLPVAALGVGAALAAAVALGGALAFSAEWETGFVVGTSVVTLMMVFVIQHTQSREQAATQRKLDELLRALPGAEMGLMMLEEAPEEELRGVEEKQRETKDGLRRGGDGQPASTDQVGGVARSHTMAASPEPCRSR